MKPEAGSLIEKTKKSSATISTSNSCLVSKPKRPLCGYNFFFQQERQILLANRPVRPEGVPRNGHGKMGFAEMARTIAAKWKQLDREQKEQFQLMGKQEKIRYERELAEWKEKYEQEPQDQDSQGDGKEEHTCQLPHQDDHQQEKQESRCREEESRYDANTPGMPQAH